MKNKVIIIGCGNVGMSYAYSLLNQRTFVNELILIDISKEKAEGEAMDLNHGLAYSPSKINIRAGNYKDCRDAKIVVIAAGANQKDDETRMDLIYKNNDIFKDIIQNVINNGFQGIFIIATNPVDVLTYQTWKYANLPHQKVIGTGTTLDTARLRFEISDTIKVNPKNIHAYVLGEHGDSEFVSWSNASVGVSDIKNFLTNEQQEKIEDNVRNAAYNIIDKKGNTSYGIGMSLTRITNAILGDENTILTVSSYNDKYDVFIGQPTIINKNGADKKLTIKLTSEEQEKFIHSTQILKEAINKIKD